MGRTWLGASVSRMLYNYDIGNVFNGHTHDTRCGVSKRTLLIL